ncbi:hypothetical protein CLV51_1011304 [Chitinophaga niastensis]|uniref:Uncharacterized protein n=1 Tax=Chitinophaga niastensis TaxID=536980 RepID=A0A2P8HUT3_CHINA|nr:hypothetical protein CLV51_1011304 [Chitinophaga niastensis]
MKISPDSGRTPAAEGTNPPIHKLCVITRHYITAQPDM